MRKDEKAQLIDQLTEKLKDNKNFYILDASGFTVAEINKFRGNCFEAGVEYQVAKNTFIKKALDNLDGDFTGLDSVLKGFSGIMFSGENASLPARIIETFKKTDPDKRPLFKGASIDSDLFVGEEHLKTLSQLKSKEELIGEVIGLLQAPAKKVISQLQSGGNILAGVVKTLSERAQ